MSGTREELKQDFVAKEKAEIAQLQAQGVQVCGNAFSSVLLVKGVAGPEDSDGKTLLQGRDGKGLQAALIRLGYDPSDWCGLASWDSQGSTLEPEVLRQAIAALDPETLIVCDDTAAAAIREAYAEELSALEDFTAAMLEPGVVAHICGMRVLNLGGFEASLTDVAQKRVMWERLKKIPPVSEPY